MIIGYARVSTLEQNERLQTDALDKAGCERVFTDHASGAKAHRPELDRLLDIIREGENVRYCPRDLAAGFHGQARARQSQCVHAR